MAVRTRTVTKSVSPYFNKASVMSRTPESGIVTVTPIYLAGTLKMQWRSLFQLEPVERMRMLAHDWYGPGFEDDLYPWTPKP
jgi:hypothetical protein